MCLPFLAPLAALAPALTGAGMSAATAGTMVAATAASTAVSAYGAIQQGKAAAAAGKYNATMAEYSAQDSLRRGEEAAMKITRDARTMKSAQRANLAGRGVAVGFGTAQDLQDQTDFFSAIDADTARYNAQTEAWTSRAGGQLALAEGRNAKTQGYLSAAGTILGTAGKVAGKWYT